MPVADEAPPVLVTGVGGYIGALVATELGRRGHRVRGFSRRPEQVRLKLPIAAGDAITGAGLDQALSGIEVAYFLIHSMEPSDSPAFHERELIAAERFATAARRAGVRRIVYLGGPEPREGPLSPHLASRLAVERILLDAVPDSVALRASIVIGARSRAFRLLVRLIERLPVLILPGWREHRGMPIDERDVVSLLIACASDPRPAGMALDAAGPELVSYEQLIRRIADAMLVARPMIGTGSLTVTPVAARISAVIAGERPELIVPLMESLESDLVPAGPFAADLLDVRLHSLDAAIEHALGQWERDEPLAAH